MHRILMPLVEMSGEEELEVEGRLGQLEEYQDTGDTYVEARPGRGQGTVRGGAGSGGV